MEETNKDVVVNVGLPLPSERKHRTTVPLGDRPRTLKDLREVTYLLGDF